MTPSEAISGDGILAPYFAEATWARWKAVLRAAFAEPMSAGEVSLFKEVAGDREPPTVPVRELWTIVVQPPLVTPQR
jgi:hypothetical protein